jgi:hypothetical protein
MRAIERGLRRWSGEQCHETYCAAGCVYLICSAVMVKHDSDHTLTPDDRNEVMEKVALLENTGLPPILLPVSMRNRDTLQLTDEQTSAFRNWRKDNYVNVQSVMNEIIERKIQLGVEAPTPEVPENRLFALQSEIQLLQRELPGIKLSCRKPVMRRFNDEQWSNHAFVVSDNPKPASLMSQVNSPAVTATR